MGNPVKRGRPRIHDIPTRHIVIRLTDDEFEVLMNNLPKDTRERGLMIFRAVRDYDCMPYGWEKQPEPEEKSNEA
jgi:hypothetical protein